METAPDPATSLTLLNLLCGPDQNETAWRDFHERYRPLIGRWCARWRLQTADADDVSQRVLQRVFASIGTYDRGRGAFRAWLKTVVENAVKDFLRGRSRHPGDQGSGDSDVAEFLNAVAQPESLDGLAQELDTSLRRDLDEIQARVEKEVEPDTMRAFRWVILENMPIPDAAAKLGKSTAAIGMGIHRVKKKLREEYARLHERTPNQREDRP
jgi:RNA polymerase sigma factor (sigma-70 family)